MDRSTTETTAGYTGVPTTILQQMTDKSKHVPQGYKDSPLGIIPKEWEVKRILDFAPLQRGFDLPTEKIVKGAYPVVYSNGILNFHIEYKAKGPGVVTGRSGTIGKVTYVESDYWPHNTSLWVTDFKGNNPKYVYYVYKYIGLSKFSSGSGVPTLNRNDVHVSKIAIPPIEEQGCIVKVLELWDSAIEKQSELIEKLKLRKRALMQQLLTGKKRLPGFSGEWKEVKLGDVFDERNETNRDGLSLLSITGDRGVIYQSDSDKRDISNDDKSKYKRICPNDIGYNTMRMWQGRSALSELEGIVSPAYTIVTPRKSINVKFMAMLIQQSRVVYDFWTHSQGLVSDTLNCKYPDFCQVKVHIPTREEQTAIASVLVQADKEIELAKEKLNNLQSQKRGLMQQLLTGKKRII